MDCGVTQLIFFMAQIIQLVCPFFCTGDVLELVPSSNGRWIAKVIKQDNVVFFVCNVYGFNLHVASKSLFNIITSKLKVLIDKHKSSVSPCGDFNKCSSETKDRHPPPQESRVNYSSQGSGLISSLCSDLCLTDAWPFLYTGTKDFT